MILPAFQLLWELCHPFISEMILSTFQPLC
jgi:hypothetical protein